VDILNILTKLFDNWGYWIVFFGVMLENLAIPVPGETILLAAGFFASLSHFSVVNVIVVASIGAIMGDNGSYWVGRKFGRNLMIRYGKYLLLTEKRFRAMDRYFEKYGDKTVLFARFFAGFRVFAGLFAGASRMDWHKFFLFNALGAILWVITIASVGFFFGHSWKLLERDTKWAGLIMAGIVVLVFLIYTFLKHKKKKK
jgi:membrane protein DedA with SNARE-associated domain